MFTQTNNIRKQEPPALESMLSAFESMREMLANVKKLRYLETERAPFQPVISKTKFYDMVIIHPASLQVFLAQFKMSDSQLLYLGFSPASNAECMEWVKELAENLR